MKIKETVKDVNNMCHGYVKAKNDFGDIPKSAVGVVTAYLPEQNIFCIYYKDGFITLKCTEPEFKDNFEFIYDA